jgi:hypothetical protein
MSSAASAEQAISQMLHQSLPARLRDEIGVKDAKEWVREHLDAYAEERAQFPDQALLPWTNMISYEDWVEDTFFVVLILRDDAVELFCGTGYLPDVRALGDRESIDIPAEELHRAWAARFTVPCVPLVLGRAVVREWLGRDW